MQPIENIIAVIQSNDPRLQERPIGKRGDIFRQMSAEPDSLINLTAPSPEDLLIQGRLEIEDALNA